MSCYYLLDTTPPNVICPEDIFVATEPNLHYAIVNISLPKADGKLQKIKIPSKQKQKRILLGMKPCHNPCNTCPYVLTTSDAKSSQTKEMVKLTGSFNCNTYGIVYLTTCEKCKTIYWPNWQKTEREGEHLYNICQNKR
jgi:hypothetical protein